jgi:hypothetical protein
VKKNLLSWAALAAVLLAAGCGDPDAAASTDPTPGATPSTTPTTTPSTAPSTTPVPTMSPVVLTKANLAPKVTAALLAKRTFRATSRLTDDDGTAVLTADLRLRPDGTFDVATSMDKGRAVRIGQALYFKDASLTKDPKRPWTKLDRDSDNIGVLLAVGMVDLIITQAGPHQILGGAAHATTFRQIGVTTVEGIPATRYKFGIDLKKATAAGALGDYIDKEDAMSAPRILTVDAVIDAENLPRKITFLGPDNASVDVSFSRFGDNLAITAPPKAQIGSIKS